MPVEMAHFGHCVDRCEHMMRTLRVLGVIALLFLPHPCLAEVGDLVVGWTDVRQSIDGWGASDAFSAPNMMTDQQADLLFGQMNGIGLSFLRVGIRSDGTDYASMTNITKASERGAKVWAVPWTAPAGWKDNSDTSNGGHLCAVGGQGTCTGSHYDDWANRLASFVTSVKSTTGVDLYAISVQNEPDYTPPPPSYDSMLYTDEEMVNFVKVLGSKLASLPVQPKLICGEYSNWGRLWSLASAIEHDTDALAFTDIYAAHQYGGVSAYQGPRSRSIWQTEMSNFESFDARIIHGVTVAKWIWDAIVNGNVTAWHYWWLAIPQYFNSDNQALISSDGTAGKHLYTFGNYSKFVRPGWVRVGADGLTNRNLHATAYKNATTGDFAVVVVNDSGGDLSFAASFTGATVASVTPYITDATRDLIAQPGVTVTTGRFTYTVPYGVTTFVGTGATAPNRCTGDCDGSLEVTIDELLMMVNIALGSADVSTCPVGDLDSSGDITVNEIIQAVGFALGGCPGS
jgi:glucuronoarabinoxylan endo-1,4-beta-xylanase